MKKIKNFNILSIPIYKIVFITTSNPEYEMNRTMLVENYPEFRDFVLVDGWHCSCYDFDDTTWEAIQYSKEEIIQIATSWIDKGHESERLIAPLILRHFQNY